MEKKWKWELLVILFKKYIMLGLISGHFFLKKKESADPNQSPPLFNPFVDPQMILGKLIIGHPDTRGDAAGVSML